MHTDEHRPNDREDIMNRSHRRRTRHRHGTARAATVLGVLLMGLVLASCDFFDRALGVEAAGVVDAEVLSDPENAPLLVTGAIADLECALGGYVVNQALLGNELQDASVTAARFSLDRRDISPASPYGLNSCAGNPPGIYRPLSTARWSTDNALAHLDEWTDQEVENRTELIGQASAYGGYALLLMGEGFCSVVIEEDGPEVQPEDAFMAAVTRFDRAIDAARTAGDTETETMALLGRARTNLNLGNTDAAAADARAALDNDPQFEILAETSTTSSRRYNRVGDEFWLGRSTVNHPYRDLTVGGVSDPRVDVIDTGELGHDSETPVWMATKYGSEYGTELRGAPLPIATWREAHLIIAEAEGGQEAVNRINVLRDHWDLPTFQSANETEIQEQVIEERARELFLEGHHLNDLRRFNLEQQPAPGESYRQGGIYGNTRCFPLPDVERDNNPNA